MSGHILGKNTFQPNPDHTVRSCYCQNDVGSVQVGFLYRGSQTDPRFLEMILIGVQKYGGKKICLCLEYDGERLWGKDNNISDIGEPLDEKTWEGFFTTARRVINLSLPLEKEVCLLLQATLDQAERAPYLPIGESALEQAL